MKLHCSQELAAIAEDFDPLEVSEVAEGSTSSLLIAKVSFLELQYYTIVLSTSKKEAIIVSRVYRSHLGSSIRSHDKPLSLSYYEETRQIRQRKQFES